MLIIKTALTEVVRLENIEEIRKKVRQMVDKAGNHVEKGIEDLVIGLQWLKIATKSSCEGHLTHGGKYPWIDVSFSEAEKICQIVFWQNKSQTSSKAQNRNTWIIRPGVFLRLIPENRNLPLERLQKFAQEFGLALQRIRIELSEGKPFQLETISMSLPNIENIETCFFIFNNLSFCLFFKFC
ncbi:MAG: hypothetical protein V1841_00525 [Patescibacteria group bacterium]